MDNSVYKTPASSQNQNTPPTQTKRSKVGFVFAILGCILLMALPIGIISSIISIVDTMQTIVLYGDETDAKVMADALSKTLVDTALGLITSLPGFILMAIAIIIFQYRRPWVYRVSMIASFVMLILFPIGTVFAIILLIVLFKRKASFFK